MRLHHLEVTAFGPFSGTARVDFDRLSEAGLFLLSGATGAGKTSVLDAVCFALYGDVPGDRSMAKRLRADQAEPSLAPRVELEATLSGRRFRIVRSPSWQRPKKRGAGVTTEQPSVRIAERIAGEWVTLSTRLDETGHLVAGLLGMNLTQFTQVAMLPQGRFQAFLRARSDERHRLLQQLFRTGHFDQVEKWLCERRVVLKRTRDAAHRELADLVSRLSEVVTTPLPEDWDISDLAGPADDGSLADWAVDLAATVRHQSQEARGASVRAGAAEAAARLALDVGRSLAARRTALDAAHADRAALEDEAAEVAAHRRSLDAASRATAVVPVHRLVARATTVHSTAREAAARASAAAGALLGLEEVAHDTLVAAEARARDTTATVRAALPRDAALADLARVLATDNARGQELTFARAALQEARVELPARAAAIAVELEQARAAAEGLAVVTGAMDDLEARGEAVGVCARLEMELIEARELLLATREVVLTRQGHVLDLRTARIEGMAAELAGALAVGACCPVCGSDHHPQKALAAPGAPDADAERTANRGLDDAKLVEHARDSRVRDLTTQLAVARERAGDETIDAIRARLRDLRDEAATLVERASRVEPLTIGLEALALEESRLATELADHDRELAALQERLRIGRTQHDAARAEIDALLDGTGAGDLTELLDREADRAAAARAAVRRLDELTVAEATLAEARDALGAAVSAAGFADADAALAAALPPDQIAALTQRVRQHERRLDAVTTVLDAPDAAEVRATPVPDLEALEAAHAAGLDALGAARAHLQRWTQASTRLDALTTGVTHALARWRPLHDEWRLASELAAFCEGKSPDNRLQMRLSAYVLAFRLSQVVAAANERLSRMSDRRYSLEHTGRAGAGETRGGLSLVVRDDWSGETRDPATLSGGETFVVSLALALGLADVITHEAGGADLDTLFVDEGFGSLDADTLDDVLDTLDTLRDGGRVVGVVSHVAEMRDRIPTQLVVTKARAGSTLSVRG